MLEIKYINTIIIPAVMFITNIDLLINEEQWYSFKPKTDKNNYI